MNTFSDNNYFKIITKSKKKNKYKIGYVLIQCEQLPL